MTSRLWFRVLALKDHRGELSAPLRRLSKFLTYQRIGRRSGRIIGRRHTHQVDGGMALAERYAAVYDLAPDRFWADLKAAKQAGVAERIVAPAPGRKAVYALVLEYRAIPHDLPEDLARALGVHDLPQAEEPDQDAACGHLTEMTAPRWDLQAPPLEEPHKAAELAARLAAEPRWQHPAGTPAALAAEAIGKAARHLPDDERPDLRCIATTSRTGAAEHHPVFDMFTEPKTSPYTRGVFPPGGFSSAGGRELRLSKILEEQETTPSAAPTNRRPLLAGDDPASRARWVLARAWHAWRSELGSGKMILTSGRYDDAGDWYSNPAWDDLLHVVTLAVQRTTPTTVLEVLTSSVRGAVDVGRLAAWRCWRLVNTHRNKPGHAPRHRPVPITARQVAWDAMPPPDLHRLRHQQAQAPTSTAQLAARRAQHRRAEEERRRVAETEHARYLERIGANPGPMREPEEVHLSQYPTPVESVAPVDFDQLPPAERARIAAARARAERAARGKAPRQSRNAAAAEARQQAGTDRLMARLRRKTGDDQDQNG
ncbi:hypothetical protein ACIQU6_30655 [Streptomyces sp. NPDC090442]|uniref:hypothetical protein n=1 Tax=Streptomyces sp. NPDC090442 TaxID=3365962 RepID=UPI00382E5F68